MARKHGGFSTLSTSKEDEGKQLTSEESKKKGFSVTPGRLINFSIAIVLFCVFIAAVVVVGTLADVQRAVKNNPDNSSNTHGCILYGKCENPVGSQACKFYYDTSYECEFTIAVFVIIFVIAFVLLVVSVVRGILGYDIWLTAIIEVVILALCLLLAFIVSVMVSIGLALTCNAVKRHNGDSGSCNQDVPDNPLDTKKSFMFYHRINSMQAAAWFTCIFLAAALLIFIIRVVIYFRRLKRIKNAREVLTANDQLSESLPPRPV